MRAAVINISSDASRLHASGVARETYSTMSDGQAAVLIAAAIGAAGAIGASVVAFVFQRQMWREASRRDAGLRVDAAFADYLRAVDSLVAQMILAPHPRPLNRLMKVLDRLLGDVLEMAAHFLHRSLYGFRWERLLDSFYASHAQLIVVLPDLRGALGTAHKVLFEQGSFAEQEQIERWKQARETLIAEFNAHRAD